MTKINSIVGSDVDKFISLLKQETDDSSPCPLEKEAFFSIRMDNDYLTPKGQIYKNQLLDVKYRREIQRPISTCAVGTLFTWEDLEYSSQGQQSSVAPISWTFAKGFQFSYYRSFPSCSFPQEEIDTAKSSESLGVWYNHLISTPAVNLLYLITWDVLTFEDYNSILWAGLPQKCGKNIEIGPLDKAYAQLHFKDCEEEQSYFKHNSLSATLLGYSVVNEQCAAIFEFRGVGQLHVQARRTEQQESANQEGESFYLGKIFTDLQTGDILAGDLIEQLTVSVTNRRGKIIPLQKRRSVHVRKLS